MSHHVAAIEWVLEGDFASGRYSRAHRIRFDGGVDVPGSASPQAAPRLFTRADAVDPEEMFTASLSACHMLWFLHLAREAGWVVERYEDQAIGTLAKGPDGRMAMTDVALDPTIVFCGRQPSVPEIDALHHRAHDACFIANSVTTTVRLRKDD